VRGDLWAEALTYLHQAGAKTLSRSAYAQSVAYLEQALAAVPKLPHTRPVLEQAIDVRFDLRTSLNPSGDLERVLGYLEEAEELARSLGDQRRLGWASAYVSFHCWQTGFGTKGCALAERVQEIARSLDDVPLRVAAGMAFGTNLEVSGDYRRAETSFRNVVELLGAKLSRERFGFVALPGSMARSHLALCLAELGQFEPAARLGADGIAVAEEVSHPWSLSHACMDAAGLYRIRGDFDTAVRLLERALALSREWNLEFFVPDINQGLGHVHGLRGDLETGLSLLMEACRAIEPARPRRFDAMSCTHLGEVQMRRPAG
jgi:tetratricopeptide (TPR) repeat protein